VALKLGDFELLAARDGTFRLDGGAMFGIVPKSLWSKIDPADERNRILIALNPLLVRTGSQNILVDTGLGDTRGKKFDDLYDVNCGRLLDSLAALGTPADRIDVVVLTHLHFDHSGGTVYRGEDGILRTAFPNARYVIQQREWEDAHDTNEVTKSSYFLEELDAVESSGQIELIKGGVEIVPGVRTVVTGGHTAGHQVVLVESGGQTCIFWGDLIPMAAHVNMAYIMSYDLYPVNTLEQKRLWLGQAIEEGWTSYFEHDPRITFARLARTERRINVEPVRSDGS
jgi:glyoxylase-like metal-dependent hydrolase (beta-lactamase superfamily II)